MTNVKPELKDRDVLSEDEVRAMIEAAGRLPREFERLRARALVAVFRLTGKRVSEVAAMRMDDVWVDEDYLYMRFRVLKRWRRVRIMRGDQVLRVERRREDLKTIKRIRLDDPQYGWLAAYVLDWWWWLKKHARECEYLFPSMFYNPQTRRFFIKRGRHMTRVRIHQLLKELNPRAWPHLFRDTIAADIVRAGRDLINIYRVMDTLDHKTHHTAFNYMRRYAAQTIGGESPDRGGRDDKPTERREYPSGK